jgi:hypothetical protein
MLFSRVGISPTHEKATMGNMKVLYIRSLAYAGTTWINLVLGSHPEVFALGVPDIAHKLKPEQGGGACSVHGGRCSFWPKFIRSYDRNENFMLQLARYAGKRLIIMNNISREMLERWVVHPDVDLRYAVVVRDGRANVTSALRHTPELFVDRFHAIRTWLQPAWTNLFNDIPDDPDLAITIRYEDFVTDHRAQVERVGRLLGIEYPPNAIRFWEYEHHFVNGNTGTIGLLREMQGIGRPTHQREGYYKDLTEHTRRAPEQPKLDESWKEFLTRDDRLAYDYAVGPLHEKMGYERDRFGADEVEAFLVKYNLPSDPALAPLSYRGDVCEPAPVAPVVPFRNRLARILSSAKARLLH